MENFISGDIFFPIGALILGLGIAYGMWQYKTRNRANDRIADPVVRDRYEHPEKWDG